MYSVSSASSARCRLSVRGLDLWWLLFISGPLFSLVAPGLVAGRSKTLLKKKTLRVFGWARGPSLYVRRQDTSFRASGICPEAAVRSWAATSRRALESSEEKPPTQGWWPGAFDLPAGSHGLLAGAAFSEINHSPAAGYYTDSRPEPRSRLMTQTILRCWTGSKFPTGCHLASGKTYFT